MGYEGSFLATDAAVTIAAKATNAHKGYQTTEIVRSGYSEDCLEKRNQPLACSSEIIHSLRQMLRAEKQKQEG